jgi:polysaccharide pyruvyl transferase CsaB
MKKMILIAGYYGFGNSGDEMILAAIIQNLHTMDPDLSITVVSGNPEDTKRYHQVDTIPWMDIQQIIEAAQHSDLVIIGGGGLFHDYWGVDPSTIFTSKHIGISFCASIAFLSMIYKKKLMLYGVGVGPLYSSDGKELVRAIAEIASIISVRDDESKELLSDLGVAREQIFVTSDPAFSYRLYQNKVDNKVKTKNPNPTLGIALRNWDVSVSPESWERQLAEGIDHFLETHPTGKAVFIPFQNQEGQLLDDYDIAQRVKGLLKISDRVEIIDNSISCQDRENEISNCDLVLGMRLHSIIMAARYGIPVVGLIYDPKVRVILEQLGITEYGLELDNITNSSVASLLENAYVNRERLSGKINSRNKQLEKSASKNIELLQKLLEDESVDLQRLSIPAQQTLLNATISLIRQFETISISNTQLDNSKKQLTDLINQLGEEINALKNRVVDDRQTITSLDNELNVIKGSHGWHFVLAMWKIRLLFIPHGSIRERALTGIWKVFQNICIQIFKFGKSVVRRIHIRMNRYEYAFYLYKQRWNRIFQSDLRSLKASQISGLVSIILPVYNGGEYLQEAVDSILNQTYQNFEIILVNDGSTDDSLAICEEYGRRDNRIKIINQENQKLPMALNNGFRYARGEFLTWTSHDNRYKPFFLEKMVDCLKRHPEWDMIYANMDIIGTDGTPLLDSSWFAGYQKPSGSQHIYLPRNTNELNTYANNSIGGAFLYRKRVKELIGDYNQDQFTREDYDYWMRVNSLMNLKHTDFPEPVYDYRFHPQSLTSNDAELKITSARKFLMVLDDFRRDFFLEPLVYIIDGSRFDSAAHDIVEQIKNSSAILIEADQLSRLNLPHLWLPTVYLSIAYTPEEEASFPSALPVTAIKALLWLQDGPFPREKNKRWDICLGLGNRTPDAEMESDEPGWLVSGDLKTLINALDIFVHSVQASRIERETKTNENQKIKISVIICTYRNNKGLERALRSVARQSMPQEEYEVVVVDNNPTSDTVLPIIEKIRSEEFSTLKGHLRIVNCPIMGLSFARNAGISEARSEILLFLDDDVFAQANLLEGYWKAYSEHPDAGVIGGHIILHLPENLAIIWMRGWERYWSQFVTGYKEYNPVKHWWEYPWGANWSARRIALMQIGGFRGKYGRTGNDFSGGEEIIAAALIQKLGYTVAILPQAEVIHHVDPSRFTMNHLKKTIHAGLFSQYQAQLELLLPVESTLKTRLYVIRQTLGKLFWILMHPRDPDNRANLVETYYQLSAHIQLFRQHISDDLNRFSK